MLDEAFFFNRTQGNTQSHWNAAGQLRGTFTYDSGAYFTQSDRYSLAALQGVSVFLSRTLQEESSPAHPPLFACWKTPVAPWCWWETVTRQCAIAAASRLPKLHHTHTHTHTESSANTLTYIIVASWAVASFLLLIRVALLICQWFCSLHHFQMGCLCKISSSLHIYSYSYYIILYYIYQQLRDKLPATYFSII